MTALFNMSFTCERNSVKTTQRRNSLNFLTTRSRITQAKSSIVINLLLTTSPKWFSETHFVIHFRFNSFRGMKEENYPTGYSVPTSNKDLSNFTSSYNQTHNPQEIIKASPVASRSAAVRFLRLRVRIQQGMFVSCECVLSGSGLCDGPIPRPGESYLVCVIECNQVQ
jgi:hypothetical protein